MTIEIVRYGDLAAPASFWRLNCRDRSRICNGCGPSGNIILDAFAWLIPDSILGLDISEACNIHDYCWEINMPVKHADNLFLDNMSSLIDATGGMLASPRHVMAFHYWLAVKVWKKR